MKSKNKLVTYFPAKENYFGSYLFTNVHYTVFRNYLQESQASSKR